VVTRGTVSLGVAEDPEVGPGDVLLLVQPNGRRHHQKAAQAVPADE